MPTLDVLLLPVWQEVSRHLEIGELTESIASLLGEHVPLQTLVFRRLEAEHRRVRIVATSTADSSPAEAGDVHLAAADWKRLERWIRQRKPVHSASERGRPAVVGSLPTPPGTVCMVWYLVWRLPRLR